MTGIEVNREKKNEKEKIKKHKRENEAEDTKSLWQLNYNNRVNDRNT